MRKVARKLIVCDQVEVYGAVKQREAGKALTINLEKIRILALSPKIEFQNPVCPNCEKRLKSFGKNKGFRCDKCHKKHPGKQKEEIIINREIKKGMYITSSRSQRHLTKPVRRYGLEKTCCENKGNLIDRWHNL